MWTRVRRIAVIVSVAFTLLFAVVTFTPVVVWWSGLMGGAWDAGRGDVMIILAGDLVDPHTLGINSYWRVIYGSRVWRDGQFRRLVVSGKDVAPVMKELLSARGVPAEAIMVENASTSTRENAINTARLLAGDTGRKVLVTSDLHMFRARRTFKRAGVPVAGCPFPYGRKLGNRIEVRWSVFLDLVEETVKAAYYGLRGWL